jgi:hypothetical protein
MNGKQEYPPSTRPPSKPKKKARWFWPAIGVLLCVFTAATIQRNRIRAHFWARQLAETQDPGQQAYYLASLAAVGHSAAGAIEALARHELPQNRALAVVALARLPEQSGLDELARLVGDADREVAESAALSLAFMEGVEPVQALLRAIASDSPTTAAAAAAALSRIDPPDALGALCTAASSHPHPLVRAQALESLAVCFTPAKPPLPRSPPGPQLDDTGESPSPADLRPPHTCDPVGVMVTALSDQGRFSGLLSLERQVALAAAAANRHAVPSSAVTPSPPLEPDGRTVAQVAALSLGTLTGKKFDHPTPITAADRARLVAQCRQWLADRQAAETDD